MMHSICVPGYVAEAFEEGRASHENRLKVEAGDRRALLLARIALQNIETPDWEISDGEFRSPNDVEPYGIEIVNGRGYVYSKERGMKKPIAVFRSSHLACEYFVWLVSSGQRQIDWTQHLDMLP
jgi:hypothetical protein